MNASMSQRSAKTRPARSDRPYSRADSSDPRDGGANSPASFNASMAPLPARVGMSEQADAPHSKAKSSERFAHSNPSSSESQGGRTRMKTRTSIASFARKSAAR